MRYGTHVIVSGFASRYVVRSKKPTRRRIFTSARSCVFVRIVTGFIRNGLNDRPVAVLGRGVWVPVRDCRRAPCAW